MTKKNTEASTKNAIRVFNRHATLIGTVDDITIESVDTIYEMSDYQLNIVLQEFCTVVRTQQGNRYKNGSLMVIVKTLQRAINEYHVAKWRSGMASGTISRESLPRKVTFLPPLFYFAPTRLLVL